MEHAIDIDEAISHHGFSISREWRYNNPGHWHSGVEIQLIHEGQALVQVGDWREVASPGEVVINHCHMPHEAKALDGAFLRTVIRFAPSYLEPDNRRQVCDILNQVAAKRVIIPVYSLSRILWAATQLEDVLSGRVPWAPTGALLDLVVAELLGVTQNERSTDAPLNPSSKLATQIIDFMRRNPGSGARVADLAKEFHVSSSYLHQLFKDYVGLSVQQTWLRIKIEHACCLLAQGDVPVQAVAAETGFQSLSGFERAFRRATGFAPSAYRTSRTRDRL